MSDSVSRQENDAEVIFLAPGYNDEYQIAIAQEVVEEETSRNEDEVSVEWSVRFLDRMTEGDADKPIELHTGGISHAQSTIQMKLARRDLGKSLHHLLQSSAISPDFSTLCFQYHRKFVQDFWKTYHLPSLENNQFNLLLLGLGAGAIPGHLYNHLERVHSEPKRKLKTYAVDMDAGMVSLALDVFALRRWNDDHKLAVFTEDFRATLERLPEKSINMIIVDLSGHSSNWPLLAPVPSFVDDSVLEQLSTVCSRVATVSINFLGINNDECSKWWADYVVERFKTLRSGNLNYSFEQAAQSASQASPRNYVLTLHLS